MVLNYILVGWPWSFEDMIREDEFNWYFNKFSPVLLWKHIGTRNENLNFDGLMCNNSSGERLLADGCSRVPFSPFIDLRWWWTCKLSFVSVTRPCLLFCSHTIRTELAHISEKSTVILEKYYNLIKHEKRDKPTGTRWVGWSLCYSSCFKFFKMYSANLLKTTRGQFRRQTRRRTPILKNDLTHR